MTISAKAKQKIAENRTIVEAGLMIAFSKSNATIKRWLDGDNIILTTPKDVQVLKKETGLTEKQILN